MDTPALDMTVLRWAQYQVGPAISGRVADPAVTFVRARTASAMHRAVTSRVPRTDILIMCAAVADYRPARTASGKHHADRLILTLQRTPDILKTVARMKHRALVVGFSLDDSLARARAKLRDKRLDLVVANPPETAGSDSIKPRLLFAGGRTRTLKSMPKTDFARLLVSVVCGLPRKKVR
jgi:phosphopantothenoylcysteine decarboxylase/phosphopantothenate--cysteine ligase